MPGDVLSVVLRLLIGTVFLSAAAASPDGGRPNLRMLRVPRVLPAVVGVAVMGGAFGAAAPTGAALLLVGFTAVLAAALARRRKHCLGLGGWQQASAPLLVRNLLLIGACVPLFFLPPRIGLAGLSPGSQTTWLAALSLLVIATSRWRHRPARTVPSQMAALDEEIRAWVESDGPATPRSLSAGPRSAEE